MTILYALVSREKTVLAEYTSTTGKSKIEKRQASLIVRESSGSVFGNSAWDENERAILLRATFVEQHMSSKDCHPQCDL